MYSLEGSDLRLEGSDLPLGKGQFGVEDALHDKSLSLLTCRFTKGCIHQGYFCPTCKTGASGASCSLGGREALRGTLHVSFSIIVHFVSHFSLWVNLGAVCFGLREITHFKPTDISLVILFLPLTSLPFPAKASLTVLPFFDQLDSGLLDVCCRED